MKNKFKYVSIIIGAILIIFGALVPTIFKNQKDEFTYKRDSTAGYYYCYVYITSEKDYEITDAVVVLKNAFNEYDKLTKSVESLSGTNLFKTKEENKYVYQLTINLTRDEFFDYTKVDSVSLQTSIGKRTAQEESLLSINWRIPVMVVVIMAGFVFVVIGIALISSAKIQKNLADKTRKELAKTNPEINTSNMSDKEVLAKRREIKRIELQENGEILSLFGIETKPKEKICEYCGGTNGAEAKKCSSCGANLRIKK